MAHKRSQPDRELAPNLPVIYDDHGTIALDTPFEELRPQDITFYLEMDTRVGKKTCRQTCEHCFFITEPEARARTMSLRDGKALMEELRSAGYKVFPMISDSFGHDGEFLRVFGDPVKASPVRDYRAGTDREPTRTMEKGEVWTSGAHLLDENWREHLWRAIDNGFGSVTVTFHGLLDDDLVLRPREEYPVRGVFYGQDCETVIDRIHQFNRELTSGEVERGGIPGRERESLRINIGVTIGRHNSSRTAILRYARHFERRGVAQLRFNRFKEHGQRLAELVLSPSEVARFYADIKWIHENVALALQLGVSEDWGTSGIEVMGFPDHTGWCRAGHQFFTIVGERVQLLGEDARERREVIGAIAGCVELYKPHLGQVIRVTDLASGEVRHQIEFFVEAIAELQRKRHDGTFTDGCWAPEFLREHRRKSANLKVLG